MAKIALQLEKRLPELRDLERKKIFSKSEIEEIVRRRTNFEAALLGTRAETQNFTDYIDYEQQLEKLRRLRSHRLKLQGPRTVSDWSIGRYILTLYGRATNRFPESILLWRHYIAYTHTQDSPKVISNAFASAIALHPLIPDFWVLAARFEANGDPHSGLGGGSPEAARRLLMRALRFNQSNLTIWIEWFKIEVNFAERLRKRWEMLGAAKPLELQSPTVLVPVLDNENDANEDSLQSQLPSSVSSNQRAIIDGALATLVADNVLDAFPGNIQLYKQLINVLEDLDPSFRVNLIDHIYEEMSSREVSNAIARACLATRGLCESTENDSINTADRSEESKNYIIALVSSIEKFQVACGDLGNSVNMYEVYLQWLADQFTSVKEENLRDFISGHIRKAYRKAAKTSTGSSSLTLTYIKHIASLESNQKEVAQLLERATDQFPNEESIWMERLKFETSTSSPNLSSTFRKAMLALPQSSGIWQMNLDTVAQEFARGQTSHK